MPLLEVITRCPQCRTRLTVVLDQEHGTTARNAALTCPRCQHSTLMAFPGKIVKVVRAVESADPEPAPKRRSFWSFLRGKSSEYR